MVDKYIHKVPDHNEVEYLVKSCYVIYFFEEAVVQFSALLKFGVKVQIQCDLIVVVVVKPPFLLDFDK